MSVLDQEISIKNISAAFSKNKQSGKGSNKPDRKKTTINFVGINEKQENWLLAIPFSILIIIGAVLFARFGVVKPLNSLNEARSEVSELQAQYDADVAIIEGSSELDAEFYHYTWTDMTEEENDRLSRILVAQLAGQIGNRVKAIGAYSLSGDVLTVNITADSLESISRLAMDIQDNDIVESCSVQTAQTVDTKDIIYSPQAENESGEAAADTDNDLQSKTVNVSQTVDAQLVIYLKNYSDMEEDEENTEAINDETDNAEDGE